MKFSLILCLSFLSFLYSCETKNQTDSFQQDGFDSSDIPSEQTADSVDSGIKDTPAEGVNKDIPDINDIQPEKFPDQGAEIKAEDSISDIFEFIETLPYDDLHEDNAADSKESSEDIKNIICIDCFCPCPPPSYKCGGCFEVENMPPDPCNCCGLCTTEDCDDKMPCTEDIAVGTQCKHIPIPCGNDQVCIQGMCVDDENGIISLVTKFHEYIEQENLTGLSSLFSESEYQSDAEELDMVNALPENYDNIKKYFLSMFKSLSQIKFEKTAISTLDGTGKKYFSIDETLAVTADATPFSATVEDPSGGYSSVSSYKTGDSWYEEKSENWYSFLLKKIDSQWKIISFGFGNQ